MPVLCRLRGTGHEPGSAACDTEMGETMNLETIAEAVKAYKLGASDADKARLDFFEGLYRLQQERADEAAKSCEFTPLSREEADAAYSIQKRCAAPDIILPFIHRLNFLNIDAVIKDLSLIIKKHNGDTGLTSLFFLLLYKAVEAADRIRFQTSHGSAPVNDKYQLC